MSSYEDEIGTDEHRRACEWLVQRKHGIQFNPNCPKPYLVRMVRPGAGALDWLPADETDDVFVYGATLHQAVEVAERELQEAWEIHQRKVETQHSRIAKEWGAAWHEEDDDDEDDL